MRNIFLRGNMGQCIYPGFLKRGFITDFHSDLCLTCVTSDLSNKGVLWYIVQRLNLFSFLFKLVRWFEPATGDSFPIAPPFGDQHRECGRDKQQLPRKDLGPCRIRRIPGTCLREVDHRMLQHTGPSLWSKQVTGHVACSSPPKKLYTKNYYSVFKHQCRFLKSTTEGQKISLFYLLKTSILVD